MSIRRELVVGNVNLETSLRLDTSVFGGVFDDEFKVGTDALLNLIRMG